MRITQLSLKQRRRVAEIMDDPALDEPAHHLALAGLGRINRWSHSAQVLHNAIRRLPPIDEARPLRVLDIACGGGDIAIALHHLAKQHGLPMQITGADISDTALTCARRQAKRAGADITFLRLDVLADEWPGQFDVIVSTLFFHHLDPPQVITVMKKMRHHGSVVLIDDLRRTRLGYLLAWVGTRLLSRSRVVHIDGPRSVRGAFTVGEIKEMATRAGLMPATMYRHWPQRMLLFWDARHAAL